MDMAGDYTTFYAASTTGKNIAPRVAALLDKSQISEIVDVIDADTFKRPIAGNERTVNRESQKVITVPRLMLQRLKALVKLKTVRKACRRR